MMRSLTRCVAFIPLLLTGCTTPPSSTRHSDATESADRTPTGGEAYHGLIQYRAKDAKQAIVNPTLLPGSEVKLAGGTKVIGVFVSGEAVAYPLFVLSNHQVVNDEVGGTPISASW